MSSRKTSPLLVGIALASTAIGATEAPIDFAQFENKLRMYCVACHNSQDEQGGVDFERGGSQNALMSNPTLLDNMEWAIAEEEMPPLKADKQLSRKDRQEMLAWVEWALVTLENAAPNDPGRVVMPRLNHHQYQRVVADLTGREIDTSDIFPMSGAGSSGFPNDGEGLTATPLEVEKFIGAAKYVLSFARISPSTGIIWTDRASNELMMNSEAIVDDAVFTWGVLMSKYYDRAYRRSEPEYLTDFIEAAWLYENRRDLGMANATLGDIADRYRPALPVPVLRRWHELLTSDEDRGEYLNAFSKHWKNLQPSAHVTHETVRNFVEENARRLRLLANEDEDYRWQERKDYELFHRQTIDKAGEDLFDKRRFHEVVDKATFEGTYHGFVEGDKIGDKFFVVISPAGDGNDGDIVLVRKPHAGRANDMKELPGNSVKVVSGQSKPEEGMLMVKAPAVLEITVPEGAKLIHYQVDLHPRFGQEGTIQVGTYQPGDQPDDINRLSGRLIVTTRESDRGVRMRESSAKLRNALYDRQWNIGKWKAPAKPSGQIPENLWPDTQAENLPTSLVSPRRLSAADVLSMMNAADSRVMDEMQLLLADSFRQYSDAELIDRGRKIIGDFARKAWRGQVDQVDILPLYEMLEERIRDGQSFDGAVKLPLVAIMAHPLFMYQVQDSYNREEAYELSGLELASRLSFTLWGSIPDEELLRLAESGQLQRPDVLRAQTVRMLRDPKGKRLAEDFAGYWLGYEGFEEYTGVDTEEFDAFDPRLRDAMYDEVIHFADHLLRGGASVTDALDADYTFVNERLARHYGLEGVKGSNMRAVRLPEDSPRGGVVTMGALLTKTSKPLRTSPVVRGDWVLQEILGEHVPAPPDNIPLLSDSPVDESGCTLLEQLKVHRDNPACSSCHARMDPIGVAMENFDPIGRWRMEIQPGVPVVNAAPLPDGRMLDGIGGVKAWLLDNQDKFVEHFSKKFLAYALGRKVLPTDKALLEEMQKTLAENDYRFDAMLQVVVTSEQFRKRRDELRTDVALR